MITEDAKRKARHCEAITDAIKPFFEHEPPEVTGIVLADLVATYLIGWPSASREKALELVVKYTRELIPINAMKTFGTVGHPDDGRTRQ